MGDGLKGGREARTTGRGGGWDLGAQDTGFHMKLTLCSLHSNNTSCLPSCLPLPHPCILPQHTRFCASAAEPPVLYVRPPCSPTPPQRSSQPPPRPPEAVRVLPAVRRRRAAEVAVGRMPPSHCWPCRRSSTASRPAADGGVTSPGSRNNSRLHRRRLRWGRWRRLHRLTRLYTGWRVRKCE